jgi:hypothetical protein
MHALDVMMNLVLDVFSFRDMFLCFVFHTDVSHYLVIR